MDISSEAPPWLAFNACGGARTLLRRPDSPPVPATGALGAARLLATKGHAVALAWSLCTPATAGTIRHSGFRE
jgi:hypothetical protein